MKKLRAKPGLCILLACYAGGLALWLLLHLAGLVAGRVGYATGQLAHARLTLDDFELVELMPLEEDPAALVTLGGDPQLILKDASRRVESLLVELEYTYQPTVRAVFWAAPGQDYSIRSMAYPHGRQGQLYLLPATGGQSLRLDPDSKPGNVIKVHSITINVGRPLYAYFVPTAGEAALLCFVPGLLAAALYTLHRMGLRPVAAHIKRRRMAAAAKALEGPARAEEAAPDEPAPPVADEAAGPRDENAPGRKPPPAPQLEAEPLPEGGDAP